MNDEEDSYHEFIDSTERAIALKKAYFREAAGAFIREHRGVAEEQTVKDLSDAFYSIWLGT